MTATVQDDDPVSTMSAHLLAQEQSDALLRELTERAGHLDDLRKEEADVQRVIDRLVVTARSYGLRYRDIAVATGRSVAWVQASLVRSETAAGKEG